MTTPIDLIKRDIRERHLQQLRDLDLIEGTFEASPRSDYNDLVQWTRDSEKQITKGKANSEPLTHMYTIMIITQFP